MENVYSLESVLAKPYAMQRPPRRRRVDLLVALSAGYAIFLAAALIARGTRTFRTPRERRGLL